MIRGRQQGMALIEALLAAVLLGIGLLGTVGLQARAYSALSQAGMRSEATIAAEKLMGVMSNDQNNLAAYAVSAKGEPGSRLAAWHAETSSRIPGAVIEVIVTPSAGTTLTAVDITISWTRKAGEPANTHHTRSYLASAS